jgi:putative transposase
MKYKSIYNGQSVLIPLKSINKNGIFTNTLSKINGIEKINTNLLKSDCRLIYDKFFNKFYLKCPLNFDIKTIDNKKEIVALDPGEKIFMTYHSFTETGMIGSDIKNKILKYEAKIRKLQRIINKNKSNKNKSNKTNMKIKNKKKLMYKLRKKYKKIKNIVNELHNKTALYLAKNYKKILIPIFETSNMVKNIGKQYIKNKLIEIKDQPHEKKYIEYHKIKKIKRLNNRVKFVLNSLSHYKFRQHLTNKCLEYGCELKIVTEEYTSMCCSNCGMLSDNYKKRMKTCPYCKLSINRDVNGSRNILIKNSLGNYKCRS